MVSSGLSVRWVSHSFINLGADPIVEMADKEPVKQPEPDVEDDDEPDEWYWTEF